ncbi:phosphoenolpyruvate--protein phosphotransferase [Streptomyces paludis]|uniref:Phosphoenolpyruvate-protein phosphotransferase n=1 Tax=Streptomyces paludis TaxID=2282738 RepID=A0A345HIU5_9ACTN|nr:putative PEP-binding protein [Streptomyces paludis]AXG76619.1 phosphoenolpyruvate--protein phosphotransferase [Streptomyces paludis]
MTTANQPRTVSGLGVGRSAAVAPLVLVRAAPAIPPDARRPLDPAEAPAALGLARRALAEVAADFTERAAAAPGALGDVLRSTSGMAADPELADRVRARIEEGQGPAVAVDGAIAEIIALLTAAGGLFAERSTDLTSVRDHTVARVLGLPAPGLPELRGPSVVCAVDLSPADTASLDLTKVAALVTESGGPTGHTAIIARQLGIPCVVRAAGATRIPEGTVVAVDAANGTITPDPGQALVDSLRARAEGERALAEDTSPGATADGHPVALLANVGTVDDIERLGPSAAEGVGLFRTEVLFLDAVRAPSREQQTPVYAHAFAAAKGARTVVRTLDAGADKPLAFATQEDEENPALGVRGYRLVRTLPELLEEQLAALGEATRALPAADRAQVWVMAPMISTPEEARIFARLARAHGIETVGAMIEVPAAALRADAILAEVDFVSLGTNDLAQYTMAADRLDGALTDLLDPWQPAVLSLVAATARAGTATRKPVGVCGESASDPLMALVLTGLGVTSLSMSAPALPAVRHALRHHPLSQCRAMAEAALSAPTAPQARQAALTLTAPEVTTLLGLGGERRG